MEKKEGASSELEPSIAHWTKPATKGDVARALAYAGSAITSLGAFVVSLQNDDASAREAAFEKYIKESTDLERLMKEIGGMQADGE